MSYAPYTPGNIPTYRFYVTYDAVEYEVFPLKFLSTQITYEKDPGHVFYRTKFNGSLLFGTNSIAIDDAGAEQNRMDDWDLFWTDIENVDPCAEVLLEIKRIVGGVDTTYWNGYFSTSEGKFDIDNCLFEVTPMTKDDYIIWLDKGDNEYNMIDMPTGDVPLVTTAMTRAGTTYTYTRNRFLLDVLEYIVDDIVAGAGVSSTFFTAANNPVTLAVNRLLYVTIAQKNDIKHPTATDGTTIAMVSFNSIMEMLKMFNVTWDYDGSDIILEHISYFPPAVGGIDLRDHDLAVASNKYIYTKEAMPKYEKFAWMEADADFLAHDIWYDSLCVNQDSGTNSTELSVNVTTDIEYIQDCMADPDLTDVIADEGFVFLANYLDGGNYYVQLAETGKGVAPGYPVKFNGDLSWRALHEFFFRHDRVMIEGYLNGILETFYTAKKTKRQEVSVILCEEFDPTEEITSELGETYFASAKAIVEKGSLEPSGLMKLSLLYGPADNANAGNAPAQTMQIIEVGDAILMQSTFYFILSEPADVALNANPPQIQFVCRDAGANDCLTAWTASAFAIGDRTDTLVIPWNNGCGAPWVGPPICVTIRQVDPGAWANYDIIYDDSITC